MLAQLLLQAAEAAAGGQQYPPGALYVVATPIGNLADLGLRAIHVLHRADRVACEDTRHGGTLLRHLGLHKPLLSLHGHNEHEAAQRVCAHLANGERVAYVSDAGTPGISDPGAVLVAAARAGGHPVIPIPGASSALAALSVAGDVASQGFRFVGFLPARGAERAQRITRCLGDPETQVLFEAPHRIAALAEDLAGRAGALGVDARAITVCRELTKQFETVHTTTLGELSAWLTGDSHRTRGEFALVLHALPLAPRDDGLPVAAEAALRVLVAELPLKQAVALASRITGAPRNLLYDTALR